MDLRAADRKSALAEICRALAASPEVGDAAALERAVPEREEVRRAMLEAPDPGEMAAILGKA